MRFVKTWLPVILWSAVILAASNDTFSSGQSESWLSWVFGHPVPHALNVAFRKLGHIAAYGVLGALAWRAERRAVIAIVVALMVAVTDEVRQSMTLTRTGTPADVLLDLAGAWLGMLAMRRLYKRTPV